jgi:hypothetical protein
MNKLPAHQIDTPQTQEINVRIPTRDPGIQTAS